MRHLALFARSPAPGRVKTRLSPALPAALALRLHVAMVEDAAAVLSLARADQRTLYWDDPEAGTLPAVPESIRTLPQRGDGLGERLSAAFDEMLEGGAHAVVFGTDCPALGPAELLQVFAALEECDLALHPASDGGYVAIGLRRPAAAIFQDIAWGSGQVREQTLARAAAAGLTTRVLAPALDDLDTPADLLGHLERQALPGAARAPALDRALRAMGLMAPA